MTNNKQKPVLIDPANNEKPVFFHEEDFDKQQMACELMDLREQISRLEYDLKLERELKTYWQDQVLEQFKSRKQVENELQNKALYDSLAESEADLC